VPVFDLLERPYCTVLRVEPWNAPAGRWFVAYRARHGYSWLLGNGVVDEFATLSSPIFIAPYALLGRIYNAGISLAHRRDAEMAIDLGWPPLCVGIDRLAGDLPPDLEADLLPLLTGPAVPSGAAPELSVQVGSWSLERWRFDNEISVIGTDAPLLPQQLGRLCDTDEASLSIALATANRVTRRPDGEPQEIHAASETVLEQLSARLKAAG
jgi:hypothetical protein